MSADNWAVCPRCKERNAFLIKAAHDSAHAAYGKLPLADFDRLRAEAAALEAEVEKLEPTLREDYEFYGVEDGEVIASYRGACTTCGLSVKFEHRHPFTFKVS